jgi:hypothetical protein
MNMRLECFSAINNWHEGIVKRIFYFKKKIKRLYHAAIHLLIVN